MYERIYHKQDKNLYLSELNKTFIHKNDIYALIRLLTFWNPEANHTISVYCFEFWINIHLSASDDIWENVIGQPLLKL